jgi:hypothetical protein
MKSAFFGVAAVAALALTSGSASAHPPSYYGGPVIVRPAPVFLPPPPVVIAQPGFGFGGNSFSFGVARPGFSFGFNTFDARPAFGPSFYTVPSYRYGYNGFNNGFYNYGRRW